MTSFIISTTYYTVIQREIIYEINIFFINPQTMIPAFNVWYAKNKRDITYLINAIQHTMPKERNNQKKITRLILNIRIKFEQY